MENIIQKFNQSKILVIGDAILDQYIWGDAKRISPEAPVPIVNVVKEEYRLGGAANSATNIKSLNGDVGLIAVTGKDAESDILRRMLLEADIKRWLFQDSERPTTLKTRVIAHNQHIVRIDKETTTYINDYFLSRIVTLCQENIHKIDVILISDYDKGLLSVELLQAIIAAAESTSIPVIIDPKFRNVEGYKGATIITPSLNEAKFLSGVDISDDNSARQACEIIKERFDLQAVLITRGDKGMTLVTEEWKRERHSRPLECYHLPTIAQEVYDPTGAGDTAIAVFSLALAAGASTYDAAWIANCAAGVVVSKVGTATVSTAELLHCIQQNGDKRNLS